MNGDLICVCGMGECGFCSINEQIERWEIERDLQEEREYALERKGG